MKIGFSALAASIAMWIVAGVWHEQVASRFYAPQTHADHEGIAIIFSAYLLLGTLMAILYPRFNNNRRPIIFGMMFGCIIGFLWVFPHELAMAGAHGTSLGYVFRNGAWHVVEQGIGGLIIGAFYAKKKA
jgi:hypothetical protein